MALGTFISSGSSMEADISKVPLYDVNASKLVRNWSGSVPSESLATALFAENRFAFVAAPLVRYSKLPYRVLCRRWGVDVAYSSMITSEDFIQSPFAREVEYKVTSEDRPLVVQFAAKDPVVFARAIEYVTNTCDGIDINCGCPQKWAMAEGIGSALLKKPDLICEMVKSGAKTTKKPISIKIRILDDLKETVELARRAEAMGVSWITVHGRTPKTRSSQPVNYEAVKTVKNSVKVPIIANGHCLTLEDAMKWRLETGVNGIMAGRGLMINPALFAGYTAIPKEAIADFVMLALACGYPFLTLHKQLMFMFSEIHTRSERREFNAIKSTVGLLDFLRSRNYHFEDAEYYSETNRKTFKAGELWEKFAPSLGH